MRTRWPWLFLLAGIALTAHWIKVSAAADGSFTVTNGRNGFSKTYAGS